MLSLFYTYKPRAKTSYKTSVNLLNIHKSAFGFFLIFQPVFWLHVIPGRSDILKEFPFNDSATRHSSCKSALLCFLVLCPCTD